MEKFKYKDIVIYDQEIHIIEATKENPRKINNAATVAMLGSEMLKPNDGYDYVVVRAPYDDNKSRLYIHVMEDDLTKAK